MFFKALAPTMKGHSGISFCLGFFVANPIAERSALVVGLTQQRKVVAVACWEAAQSRKETTRLKE